MVQDASLLRGALSGLGRGLWGALSKPVGGMLEFVATTLDVRNGPRVTRPGLPPAPSPPRRMGWFLPGCHDGDRLERAGQWHKPRHPRGVGPECCRGRRGAVASAARPHRRCGRSGRSRRSRVVKYQVRRLCPWPLRWYIVPLTLYPGASVQRGTAAPLGPCVVVLVGTAAAGGARLLLLPGTTDAPTAVLRQAGACAGEAVHTRWR
jgi:hypothetical protein